MEQVRRAAWPVLLLLLLALIAVQPPASVYGQPSGPAATATALTAKQQSIFATQTAVYRASPTAATSAAPPALSPTSTPAAARHAATPGSGRNVVPPAPKPAGGPQPTSTPQPKAQPAGAPAAAPTHTSPPALDAAPMVEVLAAGLNLRSGPGTGYAILGNAALGQRLPVLGQWGGCAWLQVQLADGRTVWTSGGATYSRLNVPCSRLAAVAAPTLAAPTLAAPTLAASTVAAAAPAAAATPRAQATPVPAAAASAAAGSVSAPVLISPENGADHRFSRITFAWRWDGELQAGWGFDVRAWQNDGPHNSIVDARSTASLRPDGNGVYSLEITIPPQYSQSSWNWTVAVVQLDPFALLSPEAPSFYIHVDTSTPTPRPTYTPEPQPDEDNGGDNSGDNNGDNGGDNGGVPSTEEPPVAP